MDQAHILLTRIPALQRPCDLDLLVFFAKHPRTLMTSEQLAGLLGYQLNEMARSLDLLLEAGLLTRTLNPPRAARMYVFAINGANEGWPPELVQLASTREGRLALRRVLMHSARSTDGPPTQAEDEATA
jgi:hypothetical protein